MIGVYETEITMKHALPMKNSEECEVGCGKYHKFDYTNFAHLIKGGGRCLLDIKERKLGVK